MPPEWHKMSSNDVLKTLSTTANGLTDADVSSRLLKYGPNEITAKRKTSAFHVFISQFTNFLVIILILASIVSFAVGETLDAAVIAAIIVLNAVFGFLQEMKAEKALESLKKFAVPHTTVIRDKKKAIVDAPRVVPGDILYIEAGSRIPVDARIIEFSNFKVDESVLTGESSPVTKHDNLLGDVVIADRKNMVFMGTTAVYGSCIAVATGTGMRTEFGKIAETLREGEEKTPLQKSLEVLGKQIGIIVLLICGLVFATGVLKALPVLEMFLTAVSLAVAAVPEGLPAVVTITLAIGLVRMAKKNSIVRKLPAVETLGAADVICSDKTGTLTKNQMTVRKVYFSGRVLDVTGEGYATRGEFIENGKRAFSDDLKTLLETGILCNDASLGESVVGDPTEVALIVSAGKYKISDLRETCKRVHEIHFDSDRKMMSVVYERDGQMIMYTKGAVEEVLKRCMGVLRNGNIEMMTEKDRKEIQKINDNMASGALRVLAFAYKKVRDVDDENDLVFAGLQGMIDPPRPEVKSAIAQCREAGIRVVMITGDHKNTAVAIAQELGLMDGSVLTGVDLESMDDKSLEDVVDSVCVYARVSPEHKVRIASSLKNKGHVVAMTGDGLNDAPALKRADIGIAMGIAGTDVAKEASDMVLTDDNFATIVGAVKEGREIYDNIKKFVYYLLACNTGEVMTIFFAILAGFPLPLLPLQILWMNLITDGLPALALGMEPSEPDTMKRKPRNKHERILNKGSMLYIAAIGVIMTIITLGVFYYYLSDYTLATTMAFSTLVFLQGAVAVSIRSRLPIYKIGFLTNRKLVLAVTSIFILQVIAVDALDAIFKTKALGLSEWLVVVLVTLAFFAILEAAKVLGARNKKI